MMAGGAGIQPAKILMLVLATGGTPAQAQTAPNQGPDVLIASTFVTSMTYAAALDRLAAYYDEQVGHNRSVAFPEIAPHRHFDVWHEMWVFFEPSGARTQVTLKRPADANSARVVKGWMLDFAGRLNADMPLVFREEPGLRTVEGEIYDSRKDLAGVLAAQPAMRPLKSWRHAGLFVAAVPLTEVALSQSGLHGFAGLRSPPKMRLPENSSWQSCNRARPGRRFPVPFRKKWNWKRKSTRLRKFERTLSRAAPLPRRYIIRGWI